MSTREEVTLWACTGCLFGSGVLQAYVHVEYSCFSQEHLSLLLLKVDFNAILIIDVEKYRHNVCKVTLCRCHYARLAARSSADCSRWSSVVNPCDPTLGSIDRRM